MPTSMKAVRYDRYGGPDVLAYVDVDKPKAAEGQVLVRIRAASVNPMDWKLRSGAMKDLFPQNLPTGVGQDLSGEIVEVGAGVVDLKIGDSVFAMMGFPCSAYAEFVALDQTAVARKPTSLDFVGAAASPMGASTAWQAIVDLGGLKSGGSLFVHAAAGNVGGWAVRIGHALGAHVIAAASAKDRDIVLALGADTVVDYGAGSFEQIVRDIDVVLDPLAGDIQARSWGMIKRGGILVTTLVVQQPDSEKVRGVRAAAVMAEPNGGILTRVATMIDDGRLTPRIGRVMALEQAAQAHALGEAGTLKGKIVLTTA